MTDEIRLLELRILKLERSLRRRSLAAMGSICIAGALFALTSRAEPVAKILDEVRTRHLVVVDEQDRKRVEIGQDAKNVDRISRAAGVVIFDEKGSERGGFATFSDGAAAIALDAPEGVGSAMRDRAGIKVNLDGSVFALLNNNRGDAVVQLRSDGKEGSVEIAEQDEKPKQQLVRVLTQNDDRRTTRSSD